MGEAADLHVASGRVKEPSRAAWTLAVMLGLALPATAAGVRGEVVDEAGTPVEGARVAVAPDGQPAQVAGHTTTDAHGRWLLPSLEPGRWKVSIEAEGYWPATGWAQVSGGGDTPFVRVVLLRAAEQVVQGWLREAQRHLEAGRTSEARREYERALEAVLDEGRPPILQAIARTRYLEGDVDGALATLREALLLAPGDSDGRTLLRSVARQVGRQQEAEAWLARLEREGAAALVAERIPVFELKLLADRPTGRFRTRLEEPSPLSSRRTLEDRVGGEWLADAPRSPLAAEQFQVYIPTSPGPAGSYGLFVWISPNPLGNVPDREILGVLEARGVIWVGADRSGNDRPVVDRIGLALDAAHGFARAYPVDPARIWVGGYSGGGRVASALAVCFPEVFSGGLLYMGANFFRPVSIPHRPGAHWPANFGRPAPAILEAARKSRLVLMTSAFDFNRPQTRAMASAYEAEGFEHVVYVELPDVGHHYGFRRDGFERALAHLQPGVSLPARRP